MHSIYMIYGVWYQVWKRAAASNIEETYSFYRYHILVYNFFLLSYIKLYKWQYHFQTGRPIWQQLMWHKNNHEKNSQPTMALVAFSWQNHVLCWVSRGKVNVLESICKGTWYREYVIWTYVNWTEKDRISFMVMLENRNYALGLIT